MGGKAERCLQPFVYLYMLKGALGRLRNERFFVFTHEEAEGQSGVVPWPWPQGIVGADE